MHHLLITLLSLFFIYKQNVFAEPNTTSTSQQTTPSVTEMYTTLMTATLAGVTVDDEDDPTDDDNTCLFEIMVSLSNTEDITITICGFMEAEEKYVGITVQLPQDRWVGVGFVLDDNFDTVDPMKNAYSFIIPQYSRDIKEVTFNAKTDVDGTLTYNGGKLLANKINLFEDKYSNGDRIMKLKRKLKILPTDLEAADADLVLDYFDFTDVTDKCNKAFKIIYAFGSNGRQQFKFTGNNPSFHGYNNRGYVTAKLNEINGKTCAEKEGDNAYRNYNYVISIIIAVIFVIYAF